MLKSYLEDELVVTNAFQEYLESKRCPDKDGVSQMDVANASAAMFPTYNYLLEKRIK